MLTPRETSVLQLFSRGLKAKEVAHCLGIVTDTVKLHARNASVKLRARNMVHAVYLAKSLDLIPIVVTILALLVGLLVLSPEEALRVDPSIFNRVGRVSESEHGIYDEDYCVPDPLNLYDHNDGGTYCEE